MIVKKSIVYAGIEKPQTAAELKVELLGLRNSIKIAEELISRYEQVFAIMELKQDELQISGASANQESEGPTRTESQREQD